MSDFLSKHWFPTVIVVALLLVGGWVWSTYNSMVRAQEGLSTSWAQVETQYQRRFDLIPNLQSIVQGAADFERDTFTAVTAARTQWQQASSQTDRVAAINQFDSALSRLLLTVENYPDLKATQGFRDFQVQLEGTENRVAVARRDYNEVVKDYNISLKLFPRNLLAGMFGFEPAAFFKADERAQEAPQVDFGS